MSNQQEPVRKSKSKYAKKIRRKLGKGKVDQRWMWWVERTTEQP